MDSKEYKRQWREKRKNDPEYKAKRKAQSARYYAKNKSKINAKRRKKLKEDPEYRQKVNEKQKEYREKNQNDDSYRELKNAQARDRYANLSEEERNELQKKQYQWLKNNPDKYKEYAAKKRIVRRKRYQKQLKKAVDMLGGRCKICGLVDHPIVYDFHHRNPEEKSFAISQYLGGSTWERIKIELKKCDLLCSHCHRKLTHGIV